MDERLKAIGREYSSGERFEEMPEYANRKLKIWEEEACAWFPPEAKVLDIGCGKGREAFCLHDKGFAVTGIDISHSVIAAAKRLAAENGAAVEFMVTDGKELPFQDSSFDAVIIWAQTFGLFSDEESRRGILFECNRVLKDGGVLSFSGHDREYLAENYGRHLDGEIFYPFAKSDINYRAFTQEELAGYAESAGFKVLSCKRGMVYSEQDGTVLHCECVRTTTGRPYER